MKRIVGIPPYVSLLQLFHRHHSFYNTIKAYLTIVQSINQIKVEKIIIPGGTSGEWCSRGAVAVTSPEVSNHVFIGSRIQVRCRFMLLFGSASLFEMGLPSLSVSTDTGLGYISVSQDIQNDRWFFLLIHGTTTESEVIIGWKRRRSTAAMTRMRELRKGLKAIKDLELLKLFKSEIQFELASNHFQNVQTGSLGEFAVDSDSSRSKDVVLRRKYDSGEEVAVSAILGPPNYENDLVFPRDVFVKVCVKKPTLSSILQFDCQVYQQTDETSQFDIYNAYYLRSPTCLNPSIYKGPLFSELDTELQDALKEYLVAKGIGTNLTNFLLHYMHKREQEQYVNWLKKGEAFLEKKGSMSPFSETHST
ncbi:hypothetical protein VNO77_17069 [Canavalia gladiata]|uniref:Uncharacterized protein n=1 Tax=Canavalia gladiata TaxID=3824 RepID=A0AAN9LIJ4_CANGL